MVMKDKYQLTPYMYRMCAKMDQDDLNNFIESSTTNDPVFYHMIGDVSISQLLVLRQQKISVDDYNGLEDIDEALSITIQKMYN